MKKSRIFMAAGAFLLTITAVFASKTNKKFATVTKACPAGISNVFITMPTNVLTTVGTASHTAFLQLYTGTGNWFSKTLITCGGGLNPHLLYKG